MGVVRSYHGLISKKLFNKQEVGWKLGIPCSK